MSKPHLKAKPPSTADCACAQPLPIERATHKGASETVCSRCGRPVALRLGRAG